MRVLPIVPLWALAIITVGALAVCLRAWHAAVRRRPLAWARRAMLVVVLAAMAARPGVADAEAPGAATDLDVFFVVDRTASMIAEDYDGQSPRLEGVKADLAAIVAGLPGSQFSLLGYDNDVQTLLPLTSDATAAVDSVEILHPEVTQYSTGSSLRLAVSQLEGALRAAEDREPGRRRFVFLLSDGEATALAQSDRSFEPLGDLIDGGAVLGYGTRRGGAMREWIGLDEPGAYIQDPETGRDAVSRIDEEALQAVAAELELAYEHRVEPGRFRAALRNVDVGQTQATGDIVPVREDRGWVLALPFLALVLWEVAAVTHGVARSTTVAGLGERTRHERAT